MGKKKLGKAGDRNTRNANALRRRISINGEGPEDPRERMDTRRPPMANAKATTEGA
jgi:hypothetical protein